MSILSVQSQVVYGHVGHNAAMPAWHRLGFEVWAVPTVLFSNHPGHGSHEGIVIEPTLMRDLFEGLKNRVLLADCQGVHTGYFGDPSQIPAFVAALDWVKQAHPSASYCCDPVIGDRETGIYVDPETAEKIKSALVPRADIVTPNSFELEYLTGIASSSTADTLKAADALRAMGPELVIATSVHCADRFPDGICTVAVTEDEAWLCVQPIIAHIPKGAGDLFAALIHARLLQQHSLGHALSLAATATQRILELSERAESDELLVVEGARLIETPNNPTEPIRLR
ncbi:MAG: pyridoxal kinase [Sphingomonadales bacterium]